MTDRLPHDIDLESFPTLWKGAHHDNAEEILIWLYNAIPAGTFHALVRAMPRPDDTTTD